jgi:hypothetical protein
MHSSILAHRLLSCDRENPFPQCYGSTQLPACLVSIFAELSFSVSKEITNVQKHLSDSCKSDRQTVKKSFILIGHKKTTTQRIQNAPKDTFLFTDQHIEALTVI